MKFTQQILLAGLALLFVNVAHAGILIEPHIGYTLGTFESTVTGSSSATKYDNNNVIFGARLGFKFAILMAGLDYEMVSGGKLKAQSSGVSDATLATSTPYGFVGVRLPMVRAWVGYSPADSLTGTVSSVDTKYTGSATKEGVSFTGLPILAINLEYVMHNYDKQGGNSISSVGYSKVVSNVAQLSVSAVF